MSNTATDGEGKSLPLSNSALSSLSAKAAVPAYDRTKIRPGIIHIGVGGFHRSHEAVYIDDYIAKSGETDWGILGLGLLDSDKRMQQALSSQDYLFTVVERSTDEEVARIVGSHTGFLLAPEDPQAVLDALTSESTRIVSLTITEAGYCFHPSTGMLDTTHPTIASDLKNPHAPKGAFGYIVEALRQRFDKGIAPFTVLSCDNIQGNGDVAQRMIVSFAKAISPELGKRIEEEVAFPNSMVDRITPRTTDTERNAIEREFGISDQWPVVAEPFRQWVIEDHFSAGRPNWESVGVQMVSDVSPYEKMKLRLLNASHSLMGYLGYLAGFRYIDDVARDPEFSQYVRAFMKREAEPTLDPVPGIDLNDYQQTLMVRFANSKIKDEAARICLDGSGKMPTFVLPTMRDQLARGGEISRGALCVAAWFRYLTGEDENGEQYPIEDPMAEELSRLAKKGGMDPRSLLSKSELFGDLSSNEEFIDKVEKALISLYTQGARKTLQNVLQENS
ncbi:MAG: mannitol dehydrogenase family protein [Bdellovibrionales bacterium]|nr:mannitol dehydrogenase family protein [Bdellovibrionales bacterium]